MAVDGFAFYNLHLLQSDPDCRPRNPNPSSHLQNFFIVRVRHWFVQNPIWQSQRYTFYFGIDQKCWHQQLCCKGIRLPFFPRGLSVSLPIGNVPTALDCFSVRAESITISLGINTSTSFVPSSRVAVKLHLWKTVNPRMWPSLHSGNIFRFSPRTEFANCSGLIGAGSFLLIQKSA